MRVAQVTEPGFRYTAEVGRFGFTIRMWRPRTNGGWYVKNTLTFPWWWTRS